MHGTKYTTIRYLENRPDWSFEEYTPQVVIIAIGQNDNHPDDYMKEDYDGEKALHWRSNYEKLLGRIREKYPNAWIICITTLLEHDPAWGSVCGGSLQKDTG